MKIKDIDLINLFNALKSFSFKHLVNGEETTINVVLYPDEQNAAMYKIFNSRYGSLRADDIAIEIKDGTITATTAANVLKNILVGQWKQLWLAWIADYNPIWNIDGIEQRIIETEHGLVIEHSKDSSITNEQLVDGESITEQLVNSTSENQVAPYDSQTYAPESKNITNAGKVKGTSNAGKTKSTTDGIDTDTQSGTTTVTDTYTRGGNIGVTMSSQLLSDHVSFWDKYNFFDKYFETIAKQLSIPMWEV